MFYPGTTQYSPIDWTPLHELHASVHTDTAYPCNQQDLDVLQNPYLPPPPMNRQYPPLTMRDACRHAITFLRAPKSPSRRAALARLENMHHGGSQTGSWPDIIFKVFNDLDEAYFGGVLRNRIFLCWAQGGSLSERTAGVTVGQGIGGWPRVSIHLSYPIIVERRRYGRDGMAVWETLLHEMIHAYFHVLCVNACEPQSRDPSHGPYFRKLMRELSEQSGVNLEVGAGPPT